jgi:hypothetical protein
MPTEFAVIITNPTPKYTSINLLIINYWIKLYLFLSNMLWNPITQLIMLGNYINLTLWNQKLLLPRLVWYFTKIFVKYGLIILFVRLNISLLQIFIHINDQGKHWYLLVVDLLHRKLIWLDSLPAEERYHARRHSILKLVWTTNLFFLYGYLLCFTFILHMVFIILFNYFQTNVAGHISRANSTSWFYWYSQPYFPWQFNHQLLHCSA